MSPELGPSTEIRLDARARRSRPADQALRGDAHGVTQAALSSTDPAAPLAGFKLVVLARCGRSSLTPARSATPSQQRQSSTADPNSSLTWRPVTDKEQADAIYQHHRRPHPQHPALRPAGLLQPGRGRHALGQVRQRHPGQQRQADPALEDGEAEHERLGDAVQDRAEHDRQRRPFGLGAARVLALAAAVAGQLLTNRRTNASALSATSRQPLSMVSACPRPGIFSISVTPWLSCCCL
jgi:hypothetical protein